MIMMLNIANNSGFKHWLDEDTRNSRGWYTDIITGESFRGEEAQEMLARQKEYLKGLEQEQDTDQKDDILVWIGHQSYNSIQDFVEESRELGVCRRVSRIPKGTEPGKTRVFLAHDEGIKGDAVIFGYFVVEAAEKVIYESEDELRGLPDFTRGVLLDDTYTEPERGGKIRNIGGSLYLVGELVEFDEYRDYNKIIDESATRFRSYKRVNGDEIISSRHIKLAPTERAPRTICIPEDELPKANSKWTEMEISELRRLVKEHGTLYPAFKEFSRQTNRSMRSIEYRWFNHDKMTLEGGEE